jgi:hypothetical protein
MARFKPYDYFLIGLPFWLWLGYWWGRAMAALLNVRRTGQESGGG